MSKIRIETSDIENTRVDEYPSPRKNRADVNRIAQPPPDILRSKLQFLSKKLVFKFKKENEVKVDTRLFLMRSLFLLMLEYIIYFIFQIVSYLTLVDFWQRSNFIPGIILGITYTAVVVLLILLINKKHKTLLFMLKGLEFLIALFLLGYLVAWDFGIMSLSYIVVLDILLIFISVI